MHLLGYLDFNWTFAKGDLEKWGQQISEKPGAKSGSSGMLFVSGRVTVRGGVIFRGEQNMMGTIALLARGLTEPAGAANYMKEQNKGHPANG
jgi:hypothetical protein